MAIHEKEKLMKTKRSYLFMMTFFALLFLFGCQSSQPIAETQQAVEVATAISYEQDIAPIISRSCAPCHFPDKGKKKPLDTKDAVKNNLTQILEYVQLPTTDEKFMPYQSKKTPFSKEEIDLLKQWKKDGFK